MKTLIGLTLSLLAVSNATRCSDVAGTLKQLDAGIGMVFGVNHTGSIYTRVGNSWIQLPGKLKHVTVGPAGIWGVDQDRRIYRLVAGNWVSFFGVTWLEEGAGRAEGAGRGRRGGRSLSGCDGTEANPAPSSLPDGKLTQLDAGGDQIVAGVDQFGSTFCIGPQELASAVINRSASFSSIGSRMRYYSCGPLGCWGVTLAKDVYYRLNVKPSACIGTSWSRVFGKFQNIEVGSDGRVFGISVTRQLYTRKGVTVNRPTGWGWTKIEIGNLRFNHASWDLGHLWLVRVDGKIVKCSSEDID
ncbi:fish-egg lectin-like [Carcharodon carcharias]|uniref:fish-egg lectin-like n=1 Tax=Carcharodon carcharias TaxID=13397 RepID=UPI001B7ED537|nr:fish-egg lectin-like [Carcharodon carcharias]